MKAINVKRKSWKEVLDKETTLILPAAHNALTARLIERVGFKAYQVGGFALVGASGADGIYLEGPEKMEDIERIGKEFRKIPLAISVLEGGGKTPWLAPKEFEKLGFNMVLYPTTVLFQATFAIEQALKNLEKGKPMPEDTSVTMKQFEDIVDFKYWANIEKKFDPSSGQSDNK